MSENVPMPGSDELRDEYDLAQLGAGQPGKYASAYASGRQETLDVADSSTGDLRVAIACGAIPLLTGSAIYWVWRVTWWDSLPRLGLLTVLIGTVFFVVGIFHLDRYWSHAPRREADTRSRRGIRSLLVAALLIANFPIAGFYAISAMQLMSYYIVRIANIGDRDIDSLVLLGPGIAQEVGPIRTGESKTNTLAFTTDGSLRFEAQQDQHQFQGEIDDYVTSGLEGMATVLIGNDGKFEIADRTAACAVD